MADPINLKNETDTSASDNKMRIKLDSSTLITTVKEITISMYFISSIWGVRVTVGTCSVFLGFDTGEDVGGSVCGKRVANSEGGVSVSNIGATDEDVGVVAGVEAGGLATGGEGVGNLLSRFNRENLARFLRVAEDLG